MKSDNPSNHARKRGETVRRQWELLRLIRRYPSKDSTTVLLNKLEDLGFSTTERTLQRDLNDLSGFFPIDVDTRSKPYQWFYLQGVTLLDVPGMDSHTALTFLLAKQYLQPLLPHATLKNIQGYFATAEKTLNKINTSKGAIAWPNKVRVLEVGPSRINPEIQDHVHHQVYEALLLNRQLNITYKSSNKTADFNQVNPLAVVLKDGITYLICSTEEYPITMFALHRVITAESLNIPSSSPDDFDIDEAIASGKLNFAIGKDIRLKATVSEKMSFYLETRPLSAEQEIVRTTDENLQLTATVSNTEELRWWILRWGHQIEVLEPAELRSDIANTAANIAKVYTLSSAAD